MLTEYIKKNKIRHRIRNDRVYSQTVTEKKGMLVAFVPSDSNEILIGFSLCNRKDKFDRNLGFKICESRILHYLKNKEALHPLDWAVKVPHSMKNDVKKFANRARRYYKNAEVGEWVAYL